MNSWKLYIDGASRGNPGPAGAGFCLYSNDELISAQGFFLNSCTNNQAEYMGLLLGLFAACDYLKAHETLIIMSDSQLLIEQMKGHYKVNNPALKRLHCIAHGIVLHKNIACQFHHILRSYNTYADAMANEGIEKKTPPSAEFFTFLKKYDPHV